MITSDSIMPLEEINTLPAPKKKHPWFLKLKAQFRNQFVFCGSAPFIFVLVVSYTYMDNATVPMLTDYLTASWGEENLQKTAILTNLPDYLSSYFEVIVSLMSEAYTGCFTMITFCTAVSVMGLMLLWISAASTSQFDMVYVALVLLPLGKSGKALLRDFLEDQLNEKVKAKVKKESKAEHGNTENKKEQDQIDIIRTNIWWRPAWFAGIVLTVCISYIIVNQTNSFRFAALLMGGTYLIFYSCCARCSPSTYKDLPAESNFGKICRVCKTAFRKRKFEYPTSANSYYWKNYKQNHFYNHGQELRLSPQVPWLFRWLDKAAIVQEHSADSDLSPQRQEMMKGELCTVKEVRAVKSLVPLICLGFTFFAYSLVVASGNTFFVGQAINLTPALIKSSNDIPLLFAAKSIMREISLFICWLISFGFGKLRKYRVTRNRIINFRLKSIVTAIIRICIGMLCAVICCIIAWQVELHRLSLIEKEWIENISMTTMALVPQFLLLGVAEGVVDGGLTNLFHGFVSKSMWNFSNSYSQMVIGTGKFLSIPFALVFGGWIKKTADTSNLDKYYLMLAILNFVFLLTFAYVSFSFRHAYKEEYPEDEETEIQVSNCDSQLPQHQGFKDFCNHLASTIAASLVAFVRDFLQFQGLDL